MDIDEVVETSDAEELEEEIEARRRAMAKTWARHDMNTHYLKQDSSPPRKKTKHFHNPGDEENVQALSPIKTESISTNSPRRSQSSSTMFTTTSPGPVLTSRSPTRTPGHTRVMLVAKCEEEETMLGLFTPPPDSQDPLLLLSPSRPSPTPTRQVVLPTENPRETMSTDGPQTFTPTNSPPGPRNRGLPIGLSPLPRLLFPRTPLGNRANDLSLNSSQNVVEENIDEHLIFTLAKAVPQRLNSSSLTPTFGNSSSPTSAGINARERSQSRSPSPASAKSVSSDSPSPTINEARVAQEDASVTLAQALDEGSRYSLRTRKMAQLKPFTTENLMYKRQMKAIPEAIVKNKALREHHHHRHPEDRYEEDGETQQDGYVDDGTQAEDDAWEETERRKRRREISQEASTSRNQTHYTGILQGLLDSEEEGNGVDGITKEAYRQEKQRKKEEKAREKEARKEREEESKKAKRFPMSKRNFVLPKLTRIVPTSEEENEDYPSGARQTSNAPNSPNISAAMREYFATDDYEMHNQDRHTGYDEDPFPEPPHFAYPPPGSILRNSYEDAIPIHSDEDEEMKTDGEHERRKSRSQSTKPDTDIILDLEPKKKSILHKMMPTFMINRLAKESTETIAAKARQKRQQELSRSSAGPETLLPGQTRVQAATNPRDIRDIKGDSESEVVISSDSDSLSDSPVHSRGAEVEDESDAESDTNDILTAYQRPTSEKPHKRDVIDLTHSYFSDSDGALPASAHARRRKPVRRKNGAGRLRDPSAIDYMLARSSTMERNRRSSVDPTSASHRKRSKFKHDIVTGGARKMGPERQTLLSFPTDHKNGHRTTAKQPKASGSRHDPVSEDDEDEDFYGERAGDVSDNEDDRVVEVKKPTRRERKKMKQKRAKALGVYTFRSEGTGITSGKRPGLVYITVNLEDEGFHKALLPSSAGPPQKIHWSKHYKPPLVIRKLKPLTNGEAGNTFETPPPEDPPSRIQSASDLGIPILHSGRSFGASTYIKKGWLYELTKVGDGAQHPPMILSIKLLGFDFDLDMGVEKLCSMLPKYFEDLLEFATGLPDPDIEVTRTQWTQAMRLVSQLTSWYLKSAGPEGAIALSNVVQTEVSRLVSQIEKNSVTFVDFPILSVSWFMVDISLRVRLQPTPSPVGNTEKLFKVSSCLLMSLLLQYGLNKTMQPLLDDDELNGTSLTHYTAELWVCLIHVHSVSLDETSKPQAHPFWTQLKQNLVTRAETQNSRTPYEASEDTWLTIYSVCTLSQFSVHGMTVGLPRLTACWDIVSFGLRRIHLGKAPQDAKKTSRKYDNYVALIVNRCFHLWDRYKWSLEDATTVFNQLAEIFRCRKFANLLHEKAEYSNFFRDVNWELLSKHNSNDTAYIIFLKLIIQAVREDKLYAAGQPSRKVEKLLSIAIPMGALPFTKERKPQGNEMSMFYNRMVALVIAGDLDRSSLDNRIQKARSYVDFAQVGFQLRLAVIRGMANWGSLLVQRKMNIGVFGDWIEEIANVLLAEWPQGPVSASHSAEKSNKSNVELLLLCLFGSVRKIMQICTQHSHYPEPSFLKSLKPIYVQKKILNFDSRDGMVEKEFIRLMNAYFDARSKALPPPPRPPLPAPLPTAVDEDSQESQDFGLTDDFANLDWTGADIPEALVASSKSSTEPNDANAKNEENFSAVLKDLGILKWTIYRGLKPFLEGSRKGTNLCDLWLRAWLGFSAVEAQPTSWSSALKNLDDALVKCEEEYWVRRVQLSIMFQTLRLAPMQYMTYTDRAFGVFLNTLVSDANVIETGKSDKPTVEREYVSFLLSIDGRHPLLLNTAALPARSEKSGDYELTAEQFLALRIPLLQGIFKNLNKQICQQRAGNPEVPLDVQSYVTLCRDMLSAMRNNISRIPKPSDKFTKYNDFCHEILDVLKENRELCGMESMHFWATWRP